MLNLVREYSSYYKNVTLALKAILFCSRDLEMKSKNKVREKAIENVESWIDYL